MAPSRHDRKIVDWDVKLLPKRTNKRKTDVMFYIWIVCIQSGHATNRATAPGVWIPKMCWLEGAIDGTHISSDIVLKND